MKGLSIEEKAKRYDEAIKVAADIKAGTATYITDGTPVVDAIFPELKESEDERTRKDCIKYLDLEYQHCSINEDKIKIERCITWLEKQGEKKHVPDWMPKFLDELRSKKNYFDWDEHRDIEGQILAIIKWMNPNFFNGKDGEQNPADKVEPKFKVGDKIKLKSEPSYPYREIVEIINNAYYFDDEVHLPFSKQDEWQLLPQATELSDERKSISDAIYNSVDIDCINNGVIVKKVL